MGGLYEGRETRANLPKDEERLPMANNFPKMRMRADSLVLQFPRGYSHET